MKEKNYMQSLHVLLDANHTLFTFFETIKQGCIGRKDYSHLGKHPLLPVPLEYTAAHPSVTGSLQSCTPHVTCGQPGHCVHQLLHTP